MPAFIGIQKPVANRRPEHLEITPKEIPYLENLPGAARGLLITSYFDHAEGYWHSYSSLPTGKLLDVAIVDLVDGVYCSSAPFDPARDIYLDLTTLIFQHLSFPNVAEIHEKIVADIANSFATIHQYFVNALFASQRKNRAQMSALLTILLEQSLTNFRSFFDLSNRLVATLLNLTVNAKTGRKPNQLKDSFRAVSQLSEESLIKAHGFSKPLCRFYIDQREIFDAFRTLRDNIVHHGGTVKLFFECDDGFAVPVAAREFSALRKFGIWPELSLKKNELGSFLALLAFVSKCLLRSQSLLAEVMNHINSEPSACDVQMHRLSPISGCRARNSAGHLHQ
jgi:hypothetical protein